MMTGRLHRLREWLSLLPLLLLLAAAYWLNLQVQPLPPKPDGKQRHDPDFIVNQVSATTMDVQGAPHFLMSAQKIVHYPDDDSTHLEEPRLTSLSPDQPSIYTSAREGEISSGGEDIFLRGSVRLVRAADAEQSEMVFVTDFLHVIPKRDLAETDRPVVATDAHNIIHAVGMKFDNKTRTVKLLAQVNSEHEIAKN
jgi:lipopolysaccharide export system protein LptC